jgi:hypothetical protein
MPIDNDGMSDEFSLDDAGEAFLKTLLPADKKADAGKPSDDDAGEEPRKRKDTESRDDADETETDEDAEKPSDEDKDEDGDDADDDAAETAKKYAEDGAYIKVKVGDEEAEVPVKDLARLYGQEKALTQKSQEVAERRKALDAEAARNIATHGALLQQAEARAQQYAQLDFLALSRDQSITNEELTALRTEAQDAFDTVRFLQTGLDGYMGEIAKRQQEELVERATASIKELTGPVEKGGIEGYGEQLYNDIRTFAVSAGAPKDVINNLVDPWAIRLLHDAMLFRRGKAKVETSKKVDKAPRKIVKTSQSPAATKVGRQDKVKLADAKLARSGSTDDAAEAFMARWNKNADDD